MPSKPARSPRSEHKLRLQTAVSCLYFLIGLLLGQYYSFSRPHGLSGPVHETSGPVSDNDGWKSIQVFTGLVDDWGTRNQTWFSQAKQDQLVAALFRGKRNGFFVDLAANDAEVYSNTVALEREYHWNGLCIEPNPVYWSNLTHRSCQTVAAVIGQARDEEVFFRYEAGDHGGIAGDGFDNGKRWQSHSERASTVTLEEALRRNSAPRTIDYLSLDVEGAENFIMMNFPFDEYRVKVITAERLKGPIRGYLKSQGYEFVQKLTRWGESLWVATWAKSELDLQAVERFEFPM